MRLTVEGGMTYGLLEEGNLFITPVSESAPDPANSEHMDYFLWRRRQDGYAEIWVPLRETTAGMVLWGTTDAHRPQRWPDNTPVIRIAQGNP